MALRASSKKEKLYRLVGVSVGLLCMLQAAANIGLRLSLYFSAVSKPDLEAVIKNLTEEGEVLKGKLSNVDHYLKQGWVYFKHSFYYISSSQMTWQDSRDYCLQRDADLIIINNKEEQNFARQFKKRTWIGLTDAETEGTWKWVDGTEPKERYWQTGEPNSYQNGNEDCAEIRFYKQQDNWNDESCNFRNFWICEKALAL